MRAASSWSISLLRHRTAPAHTLKHCHILKYAPVTSRTIVSTAISRSSEPVPTAQTKGKAKESAEADGSKSEASGGLPFLPRPLGVRERPTSERMSWREEMMDQDIRQAHREALYVYSACDHVEDSSWAAQSIKEATKGYFADLAATRRHGGKTWIAPPVLIREEVRLDTLYASMILSLTSSRNPSTSQTLPVRR